MLLTIATPSLSALVMYTKKVDSITHIIGDIADTQKSFLFFLAWLLQQNSHEKFQQMERKRGRGIVVIFLQYTWLWLGRPRMLLQSLLFANSTVSKRFKHMLIGCLILLFYQDLSCLDFWCCNELRSNLASITVVLQSWRHKKPWSCDSHREPRTSF